MKVSASTKRAQAHCILFLAMRVAEVVWFKQPLSPYVDVDPRQAFGTVLANNP